ncbi:host attachment protein [Hwanghaeella sp.]|uniref:host attachment protein n=1 Tax=Hwanghaeella sp. TaxID=2605943 RepID=UPI003CCBEE00
MNAYSSPTVWVVVADGERARFLEGNGALASLEPAPVPEMHNDNPSTREQGTERPGRTHDSAGTGARHALAPRVDWHKFEKEKFAHEVADIVNRAAVAKSFDRLVLIAPPQTLGNLRAALSKAAGEAVTQEIGKDLTKLSEAEVEDYLAKHTG